ncbi:terpene synthase family protein [Calothrix sp. 336/3]|uniref:terpene synthase family protein n=1 Tax=Calothrix sp. 336/3 TaxID=1337936 RepID=UPI0004E309D1|nr:terpene synthase [Calothrix sp. 336/3]AKG23809.1 terpene synthase [Calothrix sp. 336/3]
MQKLFFPELYSPFPYQVNKHVDVLADYAIEWILRFNLLTDELAYQRFLKSKFALLMSGAHPYCDLEELKIAHDWISWILMWDDQCDMSEIGEQPLLIKSFHKRFLEVLKGAEVTTKDVPLSHALHDLRERMLPMTNQKWFDGFVKTVEDYLNGMLQEAINRTNKIVPDVEGYIKLRQLTGAMEPLIELIEFCDHLQISDEARNSNYLKELKIMTNNIVCWCNDIFSAPREIASNEVHSLVLVLHHKHKLSFDESMQTTAKMHDQQVNSMIALEKYPPNFGVLVDAEVLKYVNGMHHWISSSMNWYSHTARYHTTEKLDVVIS